MLQVSQLADLCEFAENLDLALRDQFNFDLRSEHRPTQQKLLKVDKLIFPNAVETAKMDETAMRDTSVIQGKPTGAVVVDHIIRAIANLQMLYAISAIKMDT